MTTLAALTSRYESDESSPVGAEESTLTERRLATSLNGIGWRAASDTPASELAGTIASIVDGCVRGHRDLAVLRRDIAECLWQHAHPLDGSSVTRSAWEPAADALLDAYVESPEANDWFTQFEDI